MANQLPKIGWLVFTLALSSLSTNHGHPDPFVLFRGLLLGQYMVLKKLVIKHYQLNLALGLGGKKILEKIPLQGDLGFL